MAIRFVAGPGTLGFDPIAPLINMPPPGDSDTGGLTGAIIDLVIGTVAGRTPSSPQLPPLPGMNQLPQLPQNGDFTLGGAIPTNGAGCPTQACCKGQHLNKSRGCDGSPPGSKCVTNRRMNPLNSRALKRATRRLKGFERAVKSTRKQLRTLSRI